MNKKLLISPNLSQNNNKLQKINKNPTILIRYCNKITNYLKLQNKIMINHKTVILMNQY